MNKLLYFILSLMLSAGLMPLQAQTIEVDDLTAEDGKNAVFFVTDGDWQGDYPCIWAWKGDVGGEAYIENPWPGDKMDYVGSTSGGDLIYKYVFTKGDLKPSNLIITKCDYGTGEEKSQVLNTGCFVNGVYKEGQGHIKDLYVAGWYMNCNTDWSGQSFKLNQRTETIEGTDYNVYARTVSSADLGKYLNEGEQTLYFKLREYYTDNGKVVKNGAFVSAPDNDGKDFADVEEQSSISWINDNDPESGGHAFRFTPSDEYNRYTISFYRPVNSGDEFVKVTKENVSYGEGRSYTLNCYGEDGQQIDMSKYVFTHLDTPDADYYDYTYTISKEDFKKYCDPENKASATPVLYFKIRPLNDGMKVSNHNGVGDVYVNAADEAGYTFQMPAVDKLHPNEVMEAHWDSEYLDFGVKAFRLVYNDQMKEYTVKVKINGTEGIARTMVKVDFVEAYRYKGVGISEIDDAGTTGKRIYLYNLGTGKFIHADGSWGVQAALKFTDYGVPFTARKTPVQTRSYNNPQRSGVANGENCYTIESPLKAFGTGSIFLSLDVLSRGIAKIDGYEQDTDNHYLEYGGKKLLPSNYVLYTDQRDGERWMFEQETDENITGGANVYRMYYSYNKDTRCTEGGWYAGDDDAGELKLYLYGKSTGATDEVRYRKIPTNSTNQDKYPDLAYNPSTMDKTSDDYRNYLWQLVTEDDLWANFQGVLDGNRKSADASFMMTNPSIIRNYYGDHKNAQGNYDTNGWDIAATIVQPTAQNYGDVNNGNGGIQHDFIQMSGNNGHKWNYLFGGYGTVSQTIYVPAKAGWYSFKASAMDVDAGADTEMYVKIGDSGSEEAKLSIADRHDDDEIAAANDRTQQEKDLWKLYYEKPERYVNDLLFYISPEQVAAATTHAAALKTTEPTIKLEVGFNKKAGNDNAYTSFDDVHLTYLGEVSFIFDEDYTAENYGTYISSETSSDIQTYFKRKLTLGQWNTLVLPVSLTKAQLVHAFGSTVEIAQAVGLRTDDPNVIYFKRLYDYGIGQTTDDNEVIVKACTQENCDVTSTGEAYLPFYLIRISQNPTYASTGASIYDSQKHEHVDLLDGETENIYIECGKMSLTAATENIPEPVWAWATYGQENKSGVKPNNLKYKGTYFASQTDANSYVFATNGTESKMFQVANPQPVKGFRFWITDEAIDGGASGAKMLDIRMIEDNGETTTIEVPELTGRTSAVGDVYSAMGVLVRRQATSLKGLPGGMYIVNGKKIIIK